MNTSKDVPTTQSTTRHGQRHATVALVIAAAVLALCAFVSCAPTSNTPSGSEPTAGGLEDAVTQVSTLEALLEGAYDGVVTYERLADYGDFGIGTFAGLDGEMLAFDGDFYQVKADGVAYEVGGTMSTPFAAVTFFDADMDEEVPDGTTYEVFKSHMDGILPTVNVFHAIRVDGVFDYMKTRSVPGQQKPYPPLAEVTAHQPEFEFQSVAGTLVGFRCPDYVSGINVAGYHMHFLTEDRTAGGHVLDFTIADAGVLVDTSTSFQMLLPGEGSDFYNMGLAGASEEEVNQVEK